MWFVGAFDPVLQLVIFGRQKLGDLLISRRPPKHRQRPGESQLAPTY
jgi:hypothetical protein